VRWQQPERRRPWLVLRGWCDITAVAVSCSVRLSGTGILIGSLSPLGRYLAVIPSPRTGMSSWTGSAYPVHDLQHRVTAWL
jgi:hypothetical protein